MIAGLSLLLAACAPRASLYADGPPIESHDVRVVSADHLVIDGQDVTLADAEAPAPGGRAACRAEAMAGEQAAQAVRSMLSSARHLDVRPVNGVENRRLVNFDGLDLGQILIARGLAVAPQPIAMDWCFRTKTGARLASVDQDDSRRR